MNLSQPSSRKLLKQHADAAARAVVVDYEERPGVFTLEQALAPDAPLVQSHGVRPKGDALADTNVLETAHYEWGDLRQAQVEADVVVEHTYRFPMVTHFPIEPGGTVVVPTASGGVEVYSPVQHPYLLQRTLARVLGRPAGPVRVLAPDPGGAFGGKQNPKLEPLIAFLALRTGRTCRLVLSLEHTFQMMRRAGCRVRARTGFTRDGRLTFHEMDCDFQIGAYADVAPRVMTKGSYVGAGPYRIPSVRIDSRAVLTNTTPSTAFRGFGCPQVGVGDRVADRRGRARAGPGRPGDPSTQPGRTGEPFFRGPYEATADGHWAQSLQKAADLVGWTSDSGNRPVAAGSRSPSSRAPRRAFPSVW